jgi:hypothetical protein
MLPLRIPILFERGRPPYILARAKWDVTGLSYWIGFVVDTGAFDITLSMTDVDNLGADKDRLDESRSPVFGIGGGVRTYDMKGVTVSFTGDDLKEVAFDMPTVRVLHVGRGTGRMGGSYGIPSILGRKFMEDNGFTLHWDFTRRIAHIDIAEPCSGHGWRPRGCTSP